MKNVVISALMALTLAGPTWAHGDHAGWTKPLEQETYIAGLPGIPGIKTRHATDDIRTESAWKLTEYSPMTVLNGVKVIDVKRDNGHWTEDHEHGRYNFWVIGRDGYKWKIKSLTITEMLSLHYDSTIHHWNFKMNQNSANWYASTPAWDDDYIDYNKLNNRFKVTDYNAGYWNY